MLKSENGGFEETPINLNALLQSMVEGVILQNETGKILQFNQSALDILGLSEEQLLSQNVIDSERQDLVFPGKNHIGMKSLKSGEVLRNMILNIFRADGEMRWISLNAVPVVNGDPTKRPLLISTFTDITDMKKVMSDLKQVQLLFNISHDLMIIANQEGYFKRINPRFVEVLGYHLAEILSFKFINFVHPEEIELTQIELEKLSKKKETVHFINRYKTKTGDYRVFDWVVVPDAETNLLYFTARDITDYQAEELAAIHSSKAYSIGEMTSGLAYLLHGQLAIIGGHISFIQEQMDKGILDSKEFKEKISSIDESIQKLAKTTKELTSFARTSENEKARDISLSRILESVLELCSERFRVHGVRLNVQLDENLYLRCKESQMSHLFITLLNNAYNEVHSSRDSWVELIGKADGEMIRIQVSNSAPKSKDDLPLRFIVPQNIILENFGSYYFDQSNAHTKFIVEFPLIKKSDEDI